jgi:hypothetical protein
LIQELQTNARAGVLFPNRHSTQALTSPARICAVKNL